MALIQGTNQSEDIDGTGSSDIIFGNGGDDDIWGYGGSDDIDGGNGDDGIFGGAGNDNITGGAGVNDLFGGSGADWFIMSTRASSRSDDWIFDFQFDVDKIDVSSWGISDFSQIKSLVRTDSGGNAWFNAIYNGFDHFLTIGDVYASELISADFIYSNSAAKTETGTDYADALFGSRFNDVLRGGAANDTLLGGIGADFLYGDAGEDELIGGTGNDRLIGGTGSDFLTGGGGRDVFDFNKVAESLPGDSDRISDFQPGLDVINLATIDAVAGLAGNQAFTWIGSTGFSTAGQLNYTHSGGNTVISGSIDGDVAPEFRIVISGVFTPLASDFVL